MEILTKNAKETTRAGREFSSDLSGGEVIALKGDLGAGKTTFLQGLAKGLGIKSRIVSPTFIILREYPLKKGNFYHIDLYRLEKNIKDELENLGFFDILKDKKNIVAIEWAEKAKNYLPNNTIWINFIDTGHNERIIEIEK